MCTAQTQQQQQSSLLCALNMLTAHTHSPWLACHISTFPSLKARGCSAPMWQLPTHPQHSGSQIYPSLTSIPTSLLQAPLGLPAPALTQPLPTLRILQELCKSLGLNLTKFTQYDENTWTEVNDMKLRNYVVEKMPEKLGYNLRPREKGHSPEEIYQMALHKVGGPTSFSSPTFCAPLSWLSLMSHGLLPLAPPARSFPSPLHALLDHLTFD